MLSKTNRSSSLSSRARTKRLRTYLQAFAVAAGCVTIAAPAVARTPYDGDWSVVITTRGGACQPDIRYGVQIINGMVVNPAGGQAQIQGSVSRNGAVRVTVQAGGQWASGSGRLNSTRGGGVWRGQGNAGFLPRHMGGGTTRRLWRPSAGGGRTDLQLHAAGLSIRAAELSLRAPLLERDLTLYDSI